MAQKIQEDKASTAERVFWYLDTHAFLLLSVCRTSNGHHEI